MNSNLEIFNYFVDDLLSSDTELLKCELDIILMQYIFESVDLELLEKIHSHEDFCVAS